jgi:enamine deaminase RidA (YjgF/YER057c/UK114 family)
VKGGWAQVYKVHSYHTPLDEKALGAMVEQLKKWCPDHAPIWTVLGVEAFGAKEMLVEIDVVAYDG